MNGVKEIKIEKDVPIPENGAGRPRIYPWHEMEVGDSFTVGAKRRSSVSSLMKRLRPKKFCTRIENEMVRVWRIE